MFLSKSLTEKVLFTSTYVFQNFEVPNFQTFHFPLVVIIAAMFDNVLLLLQAFAIFCGMAIHNTVMYENVNKAMAKQKVALEVRNFFLNIIFSSLLLCKCKVRSHPMVSVLDSRSSSPGSSPDGGHCDARIEFKNTKSSGIQNQHITCIPIFMVN